MVAAAIVISLALLFVTLLVLAARENQRVMRDELRRIGIRR